MRCRTCVQFVETSAARPPARIHHAHHMDRIHRSARPRPRNRVLPHRTVASILGAGQRIAARASAPTSSSTDRPPPQARAVASTDANTAPESSARRCHASSRGRARCSDANGSAFGACRRPKQGLCMLAKFARTRITHDLRQGHSSRQSLAHVGTSSYRRGDDQLGGRSSDGLALRAHRKESRCNAGPPERTRAAFGLTSAPCEPRRTAHRAVLRFLRIELHSPHGSFTSIDARR